MHIDILTIFPGICSGPLSESIMKRAVEGGHVTIDVHDLRKWTTDKHHTTDDRPYGGGPGMVMMVEPIDKALRELKTSHSHTILLSAKGETFTQQKAQKLVNNKHLILIAGHYEGVDQRVVDHLIDEEISIGNYVLTGGELPALVLTDALVRLIPGVLGEQESLSEESHTTTGYLEYPHYTRPENYNGWKVPEILLGGHHAEIKKWRTSQSKNRK